MTKKRLPEKLTISTNHWKVPSEENALDGVVEGRPTEHQVAEAREQAPQERAVWKPNQEALDLVEKLKTFIGFRVCVQFWDSIMFMLDDEGPYPLEGDCTGVVVEPRDGFPQAFLVINNVVEIPTPHGFSALSCLEESRSVTGQLAPLARLYLVWAVKQTKTVPLKKATTLKGRVAAAANLSAMRPEKVSVAWAPFAEKLANALAKLKEDQYLILPIKRSGRFVQFAGQGSYGLRMEATGNAYLGKHDQLNADQIAALEKLGWNPPTGTPEASTPELDPDGSPNFCIEFRAPVKYATVANLAVQTLREILRVPHPAFLEYESFNADSEILVFPELGLRVAQREQAPAPQQNLPLLLLEAIRETTGATDLELDGDHEVSIRFGSSLVSVRPYADRPYALVYSALLRNVEPNDQLLRTVNDLNTRERLVRWFMSGTSVFAVAEICLAPFVPAHVKTGFTHFCHVVDGVDQVLQADFGGETAFAHMPISVARH
jgi:hypothetical protein